MRALIISLFFFLPSLAAASEAEECYIDSHDIWFSTGLEADDAHLCNFDWGAVDIICVPSLPGSGAAPHYQVIVELIGEGDWRLETLVMRDDGNYQIFHKGRWWGLTEFATEVRKQTCKATALLS